MNDHIPTWIRTYIGIPFVTGGRARSQGVDCWGLVCLVYEEQFGIELPHYSNGYADVVRDCKQISRLIERHKEPMFEVVTEDVSPSNGVVVLLHERGLPLHVALYAGKENGTKYVLHTTQDRGHSYRERLNGPELSCSEPIFFRYKGGDPKGG